MGFELMDAVLPEELAVKPTDAIRLSDEDKLVYVSTGNDD